MRCIFHVFGGKICTKINSLSFFKLLFHFIWKQLDGDRQTDLLSTGLLPQIPTTAMAQPDRARELGTPPRSPAWVAGTQVLPYAAPQEA